MLNASSVNNLVKACLAGLPARQKEIIEGRYGLNGASALTLAELGDQYGLTRERVRQIESIALKNCKAKTEGADFNDFVKSVSANLKNSGGVKREDLLLASLGASISNQGQTNRLKFLMEICGKFKQAREDSNFYPYWYLADADQKKVSNFINNLVKGANRGNFTASFASASRSSGLTDSVARNYASLSKKISANIFGEWGLSDWEEINPKTARDWAYLVLKKEQSPLHFTDIAVKVSKLRNKKAHAPTIHNELIKDGKFVLVGKGTYSLKEFGITPGTAREIISHYIKNHGPMKAGDVVKLVLKERLFKENTILINLQNRKNFKRLNDGRYTTLA